MANLPAPFLVKAPRFCMRPEITLLPLVSTLLTVKV